jgi:hypothetical protein
MLDCDAHERVGAEARERANGRRVPDFSCEEDSGGGSSLKTSGGFSSRPITSSGMLITVQRAEAAAGGGKPASRWLRHACMDSRMPSSRFVIAPCTACEPCSARTDIVLHERSLAFAQNDSASLLGMGSLSTDGSLHSSAVWMVNRCTRHRSRHRRTRSVVGPSVGSRHRRTRSVVGPSVKSRRRRTRSVVGPSVGSRHRRTRSVVGPSVGSRRRGDERYLRNVRRGALREAGGNVYRAQTNRNSRNHKPRRPREHACA